MVIVAEQKQITREEKAQIHQQVKAELVEHLYRGCLPGTLAGLGASTFLLLNCYGYTPTHLLLTWFIFFNTMMLGLTATYVAYRMYTDSLDVRSWEWAYSIMMSGCAIAWVPFVFLLPTQPVRQYLGLIALYLATIGYATGTIGVFRLCVVTMNIILIPLMLRFIVSGGLFYNILTVYTLLYLIFMISTNYRSTQWLKDSLRLKLENTLVSYQANHDLLTDLPNERLLPQFFESATRFVKNTEDVFALVCFSLNRLEIITDTLGPESSNIIIQSVANRLKLLAKQEAKPPNNTNFIITISRKDTFNIIIVPLKSNEVENRIKLLFSVLDDLFYLENQAIKMTSSIGISIYPNDGVDIHSLIVKADSAMLQAKQFGNNRYEFFKTEIHEPLPKLIEMENALYEALKHQQFQLYYQPIVDIRSGTLSGMEALLRWLHPIHGFISPINFIHIAEDTGIIIQIGEWVLKEACTQTKLWHDMGFSTLKVAVNFAEKQIRSGSIINMIRHVLDKTGFDPRYLEIEVTETEILDEKAIPIIQEFKKLGLSLVVDDFGTGYSGLSYLKRFSIDKLKIDQSFIRDIPENTDSIAIVSAILAMAKELKVKTLAEGVETKQQLEFIQEKGCDYFQGYYFSKPLEKEFFTQLLLSNKRLVEIP